MVEEMYGPPSAPCWRWTGSRVTSASLRVSTTAWQGASARVTSNTFRLVAKPPLHFAQQLVGRDAECGRDPVAPAHHVAHQLGLLRPSGVEQHRLAVAFHHLGKASEIDRVFPHLQLVGAQAFDEAAQAETLEVHGVRAQV